ncbi:hypothetical protein JB92DRAFT_3123198 [Gautieria morchelliformis]|nr:hypothetical protein JB92DRAFT_3123198 [Gautieria morchelliformis]
MVSLHYRPTRHRLLAKEKKLSTINHKAETPRRLCPSPCPRPAEHVYRIDGLLDVNPKGKHPILELIDRSENQWKRKLERQSKTLKQAVDEHRRRYKRSPPEGFEILAEFAAASNRRCSSAGTPADGLGGDTMESGDSGTRALARMGEGLIVITKGRPETGMEWDSHLARLERSHPASSQGRADGLDGRKWIRDAGGVGGAHSRRSGDPLSDPAQARTDVIVTGGGGNRHSSDGPATV